MRAPPPWPWGRSGAGDEAAEAACLDGVTEILGLGVATEPAGAHAPALVPGAVGLDERRLTIRQQVRQVVLDPPPIRFRRVARGCGAQLHHRASTGGTSRGRIGAGGDL